VEGEEFEVFKGLHLAGELADDSGIIKVTALGNSGHQEMMFNDQAQGMSGGAVQAKPTADDQGSSGADLGVASSTTGLADVMEQQGEIKHEGPLDTVKQLGVIAVRRFVRFRDPVEVIDAGKGVFVRGVLVIKLVLHKAG
jgi:hypothetical protein